jgi:hypothetical protein
MNHILQNTDQLLRGTSKTFSGMDSTTYAKYIKCGSSLNESTAYTHHSFCSLLLQ